MGSTWLPSFLPSGHHGYRLSLPGQGKGEGRGEAPSGLILSPGIPLHTLQAPNKSVE